MAISAAQAMEQISQRIAGYLPARLRSVIAPDARQELLAGIDECLLLFEDRLYRLANGGSIALTSPELADSSASTDATDSSDTPGSLNSVDTPQSAELSDSTAAQERAAELANAASALLDGAADAVSVLLLLPTDEFVAVARELPGITRDMLGSALRLQTESLLPACDEELVIAVNPDSADLFERHIALWMRQQHLDDLFAAFAGEGIFLAAVRPRLLAASDNAEDIRVQEESSSGLCSIVCRSGVLSQWIQLHNSDREQQDFEAQWQQELNAMPAAQRIELSSARDYLQCIANREDIANNNGTEDNGSVVTASESLQSGATPAAAIDAKNIAGSAYSYFPAGALQKRHRVLQGKRLRVGIYSAAAVVFIAILPFLWQSLQLSMAERELSRSQLLAVNARADQAVVVEFENEWGTVSDFPNQDITQVMFALQEALAPDQLTSLEISEGLISIEGNSEDPQAILQKLEQDPLFTEVVFARATNNTRYFIDLRLSPVNFEAYLLRYFPDD